MKKVLALVMSLVLVIGIVCAFASCGGKDSIVVGYTIYEPMNYFDKDGKTLIGAGGALKGNIWCAKLSCSPYDVDPVVAVENVTYDNLAAYYANGAITIKGNAEMIEVYSITGAKVMSQVVENSTIKADLNNGIYVVKVYNGNNVATSKVIVK